MRALLFRSKLFVPGSRPELFAKAMASAADAISIDLEDAVVEARKAEARDAVAAFLRARRSDDGKVVIVRVNGLTTPHFEADVEAIAGPGLDVLNLPKAESAEDVRAAAATLARFESATSTPAPAAILPNIESPKGLRRASRVATADARVAGLQLGFGDLLEPLGIDRDDEAAIHHIQLAVRIAAGEGGLPAFDSAFANVADVEGFRRECRAAFRLGYAGKSCIHPSQVAEVNDAFRPSPEQVTHSLRVVEAWKDASGRGLGAFMVDGRMVDLPFVLRAEAVLALARRVGQIPA